MSDPREFHVPGRPSAKARARTLKTGHTYTPKTTQTAEGKVLECYLRDYRDAPVITGPVWLAIGIRFAYPKSWSKKRVAATKYHVSRPDADNIVKLVTDALNGVAYNDDSQICEVRVSKWYAPEDGMFVCVEEVTPEEESVLWQRPQRA
jgi:Holliday junction resolvase RusA-like endonuclease